MVLVIVERTTEEHNLTRDVGMGFKSQFVPGDREKLRNVSSNNVSKR
jgi:hypothetical protein